MAARQEERARERERERERARKRERKGEGGERHCERGNTAEADSKL
jgi:hypothetical protein